MFQAVPPPFIRSSKLYTEHWVYVQLFLLLTAIVSELLQLTHDCGKKQKNILYSDCVFVALVIQHTMRMHRIVICGLTIFFFSHYLITARLSEKIFIEHKMCLSIFSKTFVRNISHSKENSSRYNQKYILALM
jgi:hypothetical protein